MTASYFADHSYANGFPAWRILLDAARTALAIDQALGREASAEVSRQFAFRTATGVDRAMARRLLVRLSIRRDLSIDIDAAAGAWAAIDTLRLEETPRSPSRARLRRRLRLIHRLRPRA